MNDTITTLRNLFRIIEQAEASIQALLDGTAEPTISGTKGFIGVKKKGRPPKVKKERKPRQPKKITKCRCKDCDVTFLSNRSLLDSTCPECNSIHIEIAE